jgi:hypothetical protein
MVPEYWQMGEDLQDAIRRAGFEADAVEGIAVDVHDLLQAAEKIRLLLGPRMLLASEEERNDLRQVLRELAFEFDHIRWHCDAAVEFLDAAARKLEQPQLSG